MECQPPGLLGQAHSSSQKCLALCTYLWGLGLLQSLQAPLTGSHTIDANTTWMNAEDLIIPKALPPAQEP